MPVAIVSAAPAGAGNIRDEFWPPRDIFRQNGSDPGGQIHSRLGESVVSGGATKSKNTNANFGYNVAVNGRSGATVGATVVGSPNGLQWSFQPWIVTIGKLGTAVSAVPPNLFGTDQFGAYRITLIAAFVNPAAAVPANVDNGLELCCAGSVALDDGQILFLGTPGLGFRVSGPRTVEAFSRAQQLGPVVSQTLLTAANGYQPFDWHAYQLVVVAAHGPTPAIAKWFIDGVQLYTKSWGPGNIMPETNANVDGFKVNLVCNGGSALGFVVDQLVFQAARDELNLP